MEAKESELINLQTENNKHKREPSNIKVKQFNENHFKSSQITSSLNSSDSKTEKYAETAEKTPLLLTSPLPRSRSTRKIN